MLKRFAEYMMGVQPGECSIFPAVRELLANLTLPNEPPSMSVNVNAANPGMQQTNNMVPMGLGSGPGVMGNTGTINPMQMQGMVGQTQVSMPIHSPYGQPINPNTMAPVMSMGQPNMGGNMQPGNMQM
jgi:mediator of RNA polymerase II transcription subunit 14